MSNQKSRYRIILVITLLFIILAIMLFFRIQAEKNLRQETKAQALVIVKTMIAKSGPANEEIILPGNVSAWHEATIYARTSGYIKKWYVDLGSHVKAGDLLAEISSPEVDAQLQQAEANLQTAIANRNLAEVTSARWQSLVKQHFVTQQAADEKASAVRALSAVVVAAEKNRDRLKELVGFERVIAPFDGIISSRSTDVGALINAGSGNSVVPLFHLVQPDPLRIYVRIPQNYTSSIKPDMKVSLQFSQYPGKYFPAKLLETANAIDPNTRTLLAQFITDNKKGELLAGGYTQVHLTIFHPHPLIRLPVNTLLFRAEGLQVATVDKNNKVILKSVTITRDFGNEVEIGNGLQPGERIILNPPDALQNGQEVKLVNSSQ
ncbi:efflux RND transporter periplasmic adaptor subunit [Legionella sp. D16C41]|uniref:efflux RND transporter periplasmic adaptor subunit n=1 Tax=Legionella sp. D16C41 TaxID=3402688 RepID=UPI003AF63924